MNKLIPTIFAAALLTSTAPAALAQSDTSVGVDLGVSTDIGADVGDGISVDAGAGAGLNAEGSAKSETGVIDLADDNNNVGVDVNSDTSATSDFGATFDSIEAGDEVDLVLWTEVASSNNADATIFADALEQDQLALDDLHSEVETNAVLMAELHAHGFDAEDVLDIRADAEGEITLYVDDRA